MPIFDILTPIISKVLDFIPDPAKKAEAQLKLQQEIDAHSQAILDALSKIDQAQAATNTEEAKSTNMFIAGWRPALGWICGASFAWSFVLQPITGFIFTAAGHPVNLPALNTSEITPVLLGMLGLGGMRTWEKSQGVQDKH